MSAIPDSSSPALTDTGPFVVVPEWVVFSDLSPAAVRLYAVLSSHADQKGVCWPGRRTMAEKIKVSVATVDRALKELTDFEAVAVEHRFAENGQRSNRYFVYRTLPHMRRGGRVDEEGGVLTDEEGPLLTGDAQNQTHSEPDPVEPDSLFAEERDDRLHHRLCRACTGPKVTVAVEALRVLLIGREFFSDHIIDEAIGVCELLDIPPRLPRYLLRVLQDRASETGQHIPDLYERFEDAGRSA